MQWILIAALLFQAAPAPAADKTVGVVMSGNIGYYQEIHKAFEATLVKEGFDHRTVDTLLQMPSPDPMSWTNAARRLAVAEVDVLVTYGAPATLAAIREAKGIPIVFAGVYAPRAAGVSSRNVTGISAKAPMPSLLKYLKKLMPFTTLAIVYNEMEPDSARQADELTQLESQYGFQTVRMTMKRPSDAGKLVFAGRADAALDVIVKSAHAAKVPTISQTGDTSEHGVILCLAPSATEQGETAARFTARMLRGEKPADMPAESPKVVDLILNLKEAEALGIKVSSDLITDAAQVIR
jgi:putative ABC transport system substrate-binding protein